MRLIEKADRAAPRKPRKKPTAAPASEPPHKETPPSCIAPSCHFDADGGEVCRDHAGATAEQLAEWRKAREPKTEGGKRARRLIEQLEGAAPGPKAA